MRASTGVEKTSTIDMTTAKDSSPTPRVRQQRRRTGKKRLKFGPPQKFPRGVRELWTSATAEEQIQAHRACTQILALWLGKRRREEVALELSIPGLRVWQLSQQALSGMLAGLLHQPKARRAREEPVMIEKVDDPRVLKKRLAERDKTISDQQDLIRLLSSLPKPRSEPSESKESTPAAKTRGRTAKVLGETGGGSLSGDASSAAR